MTTIMVVDDEFLITDILGLALEDVGYRVLKASNGKKAIELFTREIPTLVITDFMMPSMTGPELAQAIKLRDDTAHIPIILMTGAQAHVAQQNNYLFAQILGKPFDMDTLLDAIRKLIGTPEDQ
ncbi:response regulator [Pseudomonas luteola]